jgi:HEAT repeat protein
MEPEAGNGMQRAGICVIGLLAAAPALWSDTNEKCSDMLLQALDSKNPETRKHAVVALSLADRGPLFWRLTHMLDDRDVEVRIAVVTSLSEQKAPDAIDALKKALRDRTPEVSFAAAKALYHLDDPAGKEALLAVLGRQSKTASGFLTLEMRQALRMMHTPRATLLYAMREGMGFVPVPMLGAGVASMQAILSNPGVSGRATAALLLGKERDADTVIALKDALYDKDWRVRAAAVHSLALGNDPAIKKDLEPILEDTRPEVRLRAAAAWKRLAVIEQHVPGTESPVKR